MRLLRAISFLSTAALVWLTTSCGDPLEDFQVHFSPEFYDYTVAVWITDIANPDELLDGASIAIEGRDAARVFNYDGNRDIEVIDGRVAMIIGPGQEPTEDNPIQFTVKISKNGYQDRYEPIAVYPDQTYQNKVVPILSTTNLPQGAHFATTTASLNPDGSLAADLNLDVAPSGNQAMSISLPAGVTFFDENGNQLTGSALEVEVLGIEEGVDANIAMRPGGTTAQLVDNGNGLIDSSLVEATAFMDITMSVGGMPVKSFGSGVLSFSIKVPDGSFNLISGNTLGDGDSVSLLSRDERSLVWDFIGYSIIETVGSDFVFTGTSSHLSTKAYTTILHNTSSWSNSGFDREVRFEIQTNGRDISNIKMFYGKSLDNMKEYGNPIKTRWDAGRLLHVFFFNGPQTPYLFQLFIETTSGEFGPGDYNVVNRNWYESVITLPVPPPPYEATTQLYCENSLDENGNPTAFLYPPVGTMIWLYEGSAPTSFWPTYIVQTEKWNSFSTSAFQAGQTVNILALTLDGGGYLKLGHTLVQNEVFIEQVETSNCDYLSGGN